MSSVLLEPETAEVTIRFSCQNDQATLKRPALEFRVRREFVEWAQFLGQPMRYGISVWFEDIDFEVSLVSLVGHRYQLV